MNDSFDHQDFDIIVAGGGIAGLVAALTAVEGGARVALLDAQSIGGRAKTTERDGYSYNVGPHALYRAGHLRSYLVARGLAPRGAVPPAKTVQLLRDGRLWPISFTAVGIARTAVLRPRSRARVLRLLAQLPKLDTTQFVGVTWHDWLSNEADDVAGLLRMLARTATYVNAPETFDAGAALAQVQAALQGVMYLDGGWQTMVNWLAGSFRSRGGVVFENRQVLSVGSDGDVHVETSKGPMRARAAVLAGLSPDNVQRVTGGAVRGADQLGGPVHAAVLDLALNRVHDGVVFGIDEPLYLSPHAPTARLAPAGTGLVTLMRYVPDGETAADGSAAERARLGELAAAAGIHHRHVVHERFLHRLVVAQGFPTAAGGGLPGRPMADALQMPGISIAGDWVGATGQLADASSASGEAAAARALASIAKDVDVRA